MQHQGLTSITANARLRSDGPNELPQTGKRSLLRIMREVLREPMLLLLLAGSMIYLLLGDRTEALILMIFASFSVIITVLQESRSERVLEALRDLSSPRALVIRDGARVRIAGREVVRDDLLVLEEGDRIAADAVLIVAHELQVDESLLTGESMPVSKVAMPSAAEDGSDLALPPPGGEGLPAVYSGALVIRGSGLARVVATGARTEIGKIGQSLKSLDIEAPQLRREISRIVLWCALAAALAIALVVLLYALLRGGWLEAILAGIAIGMSLLPEELPVVLAVFMAMGAWRIGKVGVLTRRAAAIETLGAATVLCTDKTGTLTENRMALVELWLPSGEAMRVQPSLPLAQPFQHLIETATLGSAVQPSDPMELALQQAYASFASTAAAAQLVHRYGLRPELPAMSNIWDDGQQLSICAKGAPEAILSLCRLPADEAQQVLAAAETIASRGIRVLAVATATAPDRQWAASQRDYHYTLLGLVGFADPIRAHVPAAIAECQQAGIRVVMITGDYAATAKAIAAQAGMPSIEVLTGSELDLLDDAELARRLQTVTVFARIMPQQKLRIVEAFKAGGEVVAMTGDGVNDAPSLKAAHIGVAMGGRGTDVAREASSLVLLNDDFTAIVHSARLGRRIYDNIRKAMGFILAVHVPIAGLALLPLLLGMPILLGPIHIALLEMVIDPVCALVFEAESAERDVMKRPPRQPSEPMFSPAMLMWGVAQGALALAMLTIVYLMKVNAGAAEAEVRTLIFFGLIAQLIALILVNRSFRASLRHAFLRNNRALGIIVLAIGTVSGLLLWLPQAQALLQFTTLSVADGLLALSLGLALLLMLEGGKLLINRYRVQ